MLGPNIQGAVVDSQCLSRRPKTSPLIASAGWRLSGPPGHMAPNVLSLGVKKAKLSYRGQETPYLTRGKQRDDQPVAQEEDSAGQPARLHAHRADDRGGHHRHPG